MSPAGFEPAIPTRGRPQTLALDRFATGMGHIFAFDVDVIKQIPVVELSRARVCGRLFTGIAGSNPARSMDMCLLWALCFAR